MIESPTRHNARDFRQRYEGTIGFIQTENGNQLVHIVRVNDRGVMFLDKHNRECSANNDAGVNFEFTQVVHGWHNAGETPLYMTRTPARQWQRGICAGNTRLMEVDPKRPRLIDVQVTLDTVARIYNHVPTASKFPQVLSLQFAAVGGVLWFFDKAAGAVKDGVITLHDSFDIRQELGDIIRRNNLGYTIHD